MKQKELKKLNEIFGYEIGEEADEFDPEKCGRLVCTADRLARFLSIENKLQRVSTSFDKTFDMGTVTLECGDLSIGDAKELFGIIAEVEAIDVVPLPEGRLRLILTFTDLLREAGYEE